MAKKKSYGPWNPNYVLPPGSLIVEHLEVKGWSQAELARRLGHSAKMVSEMISGKNPVEPTTALALERVFGVKAEIWTGIESMWRTFQAREADRRLADDRIEWLKAMPLQVLRAAGVLPPGRGAAFKDAAAAREAVLVFFGVASEDAFSARWAAAQVAYRHSGKHKSSQNALRTWLRLGEREAEGVQSRPFDETLARNLVSELRKLTLEDPARILDLARTLCLKAGVIPVIVPGIEKACLSGAAYHLPSGPGVIQLSLRRNTNDHFWFTLFHELGHLILHRRGGFFVDDQATDLSNGKEEVEADNWAEEALVGRARFEAFCRRKPRSKVEVESFASEIGIHPGIVVGMLQHREIVLWANLNGLKQTFNFHTLAA